MTSVVSPTFNKTNMKLDFSFFPKHDSNFKKLNFKPVSSFEAVKNLSTTEKWFQLFCFPFLVGLVGGYKKANN